MNRKPGIFLFAVIFLAVQSGGLFPGEAVHAAGDPSGQDKDRFCPVGQVWPGYDPEYIEPGTIPGGGQTFFVLVEPSESCDCPEL